MEKQVEQPVVANETLRAQLTNKNEQYIYQLEKTLVANNVSAEQVEKELAAMLPILVENQKAGLTARQLFGTVTERVQVILAGPQRDPNAKSPSWQIAMDGGLMLGGLFALMSGIIILLNPAQAIAMGWLTLLLNFLIGGLVLMVVSKFTPDFDKPKGQRGYLKYLLVTTVAMLIWLFVIMGSQAILPASVNRALPAVVYLVIGVCALVAKWYLKKTLHITGTIM